MKSLLTSFFLFVTLLSSTKGQENKPQFLKEPATWQFERFALPPVFAPSILYKGVEELRFAPGMFSKDSLDYFTYVFVAQIDNVIAISPTDIRNYLLNYYKGLCSATAKDHKLSIDTAQINAVVIKNKDAPAKETTYNATVNLFGVFADGASVKLNMEINVIINSAAKKTYLLFIASPRDKKEPLWNDLYAIRKKSITLILFSSE
jgi:hypothetical protein